MLKIENGCKIKNNKVIFKGFSHTFSKNGITAIVGESGIGKTTLLNIISKLDNLTSGNIDNTYEKTSYKFQNPNLIRWLTAEENIMAVLPPDKKSEAMTWLKRVNLKDSAHLLPYQLSGGMAQRVAFARAIAYGGDLLLLDEPFNGIDDENKKIMKELILEKARTGLVILITHNSDDIEELNANVVKMGKEV